MAKRIIVCLTLFVLLGLNELSSAGMAFSKAPQAPAQSAGTYNADLVLAERYAPVLYFHNDEIYLPQSVDILNGLTRMRQSKRMWFDINILNNVAMQDLSSISTDGTYFLDQWFGDTGSSEYANYLSHKALYESTLSPKVGGPAPLTYAHVVRNETPRYITIQYWLFYFYNDWFNKHEGDWEVVEVILSAEEQPLWAVYSQHHGGVRRSWDSTPIEEGTHPVVYVARGSHANYFAGSEVYPFPQSVGNRQLILIDRTGSSGRTVPDIILLPTRAELAADPDGWPGAEWLSFLGRWGETAVYGDFNGPLGPADKGQQWENPFVWGIGQPLDQETWYKNRLQVKLDGTAQTQVQVWLADASGRTLSQSESLQNLAVLHIEPPKNLLAYIIGTPGAPAEVTVNWPTRDSQTVTHSSFSNLVLDASGQAVLDLSAGQVVSLSASGRLVMSPDQYFATTEIWDAPDFVWVPDYLSIREIVAGLFLSACYQS